MAFWIGPQKSRFLGEADCNEIGEITQAKGIMYITQAWGLGGSKS